MMNNERTIYSYFSQSTPYITLNISQQPYHIVSHRSDVRKNRRQNISAENVKHEKNR